jgi:hypothetical protein
VNGTNWDTEWNARFILSHYVAWGKLRRLLPSGSTALANGALQHLRVILLATALPYIFRARERKAVTATARALGKIVVVSGTMEENRHVLE